MHKLLKQVCLSCPPKTPSCIYFYVTPWIYISKQAENVVLDYNLCFSEKFGRRKKYIFSRLVKNFLENNF